MNRIMNDLYGFPRQRIKKASERGYQVCPLCKGSRIVPLTTVTVMTCPQCHGTGRKNKEVASGHS